MYGPITEEKRREQEARGAAKAVCDVVGKVMGGWGLADRLREEEVVKSWVGIVGDFVGRHSKPQRLQQGVLTVRVLQPTLKFELERVWKRDILGKLQTRFGARTVRDVKFQIG